MTLNKAIDSEGFSNFPKGTQEVRDKTRYQNKTYLGT